jgi:hypothetical protein
LADHLDYSFRLVLWAAPSFSRFQLFLQGSYFLLQISYVDGYT